MNFSLSISILRSCPYHCLYKQENGEFHVAYEVRKLGYVKHGSNQTLTLDVVIAIALGWRRLVAVIASRNTIEVIRAHQFFGIYEGKQLLRS